MKVQSYSSNEVGVEFKVWAPTFNRVTHRLYLLGSLNELGAWNIEDALQALPATDLHIWSVQASVPAMSRFEWVWLKTNALTKKVEWERPVKRFRTVSCFSAVLHTVWAEHDEVFLQSAANVELTTFKTVDDGYILALTGSSHTLGAWDLQRALTASEFPKKSGYWKVSFSFDARTNLDFKWAVVKGKDLGSVLVKEQIPHQLYGRQTWMRVAAPWMTTSTVIVDILPLNHTLDNLMGRTDIIVRERKRRLVEIRTWLVSSRDSGGFDMSNLQPPRKAVSKSPSQLRPARSAPVSPTPSVKFQREHAIEESIKKRTESLSQTERLTNQLSKDFRASPQVFAIKGVGQTEMPTDVINVDISNQVPLVECSLVLLAASQGAQQGYEEEVTAAALTSKASVTARSNVALSRSNIDKSNFYPREKRRGPDQLKTFFAALDQKFTEFSKKNFEEGDGVAEIEQFVDRVEPTIPMTWAMLSERDADLTKNPTLAEPVKMAGRMSRRGSSSVWKDNNSSIKQTMVARPSLSEVFKQKDQQQILTEAAAASRGYFSLHMTGSSGVSGGVNDVPATLGRDDTSKSIQDLSEESTNRIRWERSRGSNPELGKLESTHSKMDE